MAGCWEGFIGGGVRLLVSAVSRLDGSQTCLVGPCLRGACVCNAGFLSSVGFLTNEEYSGSLGDLREK